MHKEATGTPIGLKFLFRICCTGPDILTGIHKVLSSFFRECRHIIMPFSLVGSSGFQLMNAIKITMRFYMWLIIIKVLNNSYLNLRFLSFCIIAIDE